MRNPEQNRVSPEPPDHDHGASLVATRRDGGVSLTVAPVHDQPSDRADNQAAIAPDLKRDNRSGPATRRLSICLVNPRFEPSYWGFEYALPLYPGKKRSTMISGALPTVAALGGDYDFRILDENVEQIDWSTMSAYDIVGVTGMNVQKSRMKQILARLRRLNVFTVVGGPCASVQEEFFDGLCDVVFVGEAEHTWPRFLSDHAAGRPCARRYQQSGPTDMAHVPRPRFDLLKAGSYASGAVQYSRGCPFLCEFCDIIVIFGRKPRIKPAEQLLAELDDMRKAGFYSAFIVDDNFIGDKKKAKILLRKIIPWQQEHGYPLRLMAEASVNAADDQELLDLMYEANFRNLFIGIETPREASLKETKKFQNVWGDSLEAKLARIQNAGLDISAGFIVGFDSDDQDIFEDHYRFIQGNGILLAMVSMLTAIPQTPLYDRLKRENRLIEDDLNCNFEPKQMTREQLQTNYWKLLQRLYTPGAFLDRYFSVYKHPQYQQRRARICRLAKEGTALPTLAYGLILTWKLGWALARDGSLRKVGGAYLSRFFRTHRKYRRGVVGFAQFANRCVTHWHFYKLTREASPTHARSI